jgi:hypothetical protein
MDITPFPAETAENLKKFTTDAKILEEDESAHEPTERSFCE